MKPGYLELLIEDESLHPILKPSPGFATMKGSFPTLVQASAIALVSAGSIFVPHLLRPKMMTAAMQM